MQEPTPEQKSEMARQVKQAFAVSLVLTLAFAASGVWFAHENKQDTAPAKVQPEAVRPLSAAPIMR
ncbi:hypothetical protein [Pseudomonas sp. R5(2019)]|uniref:hypothetical protein n=1 Tax=Pseudomonas sp. R5(2019) TaxID=2697566 RepID=UPI001412969C|nr:hypothetical protein [Pseudomonas sp. R5(2019)]NBA98551.1 hypothetical protein [Pseudomonas sp. R5(2019)]